MRKKLSLISEPISFGTDGWRGVLGVDFTLERLLKVAAASAQELSYRNSKRKRNRKVIIGFDRRFLAEEMAEAIASAVRGCDLEPILSESPLPTPSCSWGVVENEALGALVITASHNPPEWLGLKIKGPLGGSVDEDFTKDVEKRLSAGGLSIPIDGNTERFDFRKAHILSIRKKFDIPLIINRLERMGLKIIVDPMHGSAAGCIGEIFGKDHHRVIEEIRNERDFAFGGNSPEPLESNLQCLIQKIKKNSELGQKTLGLVFDGDGDRIAAIDEKGKYCNTQLLMPLLIDHLARVKNLPGCVVKTVSGSDLMTLVAEDLGREVLELPVGFKFIAKEMLDKKVLLGGEESGGIGFGDHLPERDALFAAMSLIEAIIDGGQPLGERIKTLQSRFGRSHFDRIDLTLKDFDQRKRFESFLKNSPPLSIGDKPVKEVIAIDGIKMRLDKSHWLMFRFSGTEPLLRIYCEAPTKDQAHETLTLAKQLLEGK